MRTSGILTIGGAFVAILGGAFGLLMMKAFLVDKGQGFVDLSGLVVGGIVLAVGLGLVMAGRKRARVETENDERNFSDMAMALARKNGGQAMVDAVCAALKPVVSVKTPAGVVSPAFPQITVTVDAASAIALHGLLLEMDSTASTVASGAVAAPQAGDNLVTLGSFAAGAVDTVSLRATLTYRVPDAAADEQVSSVAVPATVDDVPPTVSVFVPAASDAVE